MDAGRVCAAGIIPYQELSGNYNYFDYWASGEVIMPYQELPGSYNPKLQQPAPVHIIPYQELPGNYNPVGRGQRHRQDYTIPRTARELQLVKVFFANLKHYTIPRTTTGERGQARRGGIIPCKDLTVRTPALLLGNFCVAFFVRSGYNSIRRLSIGLTASGSLVYVGM